jgi:hypothetical protein
MKEVGSVRLTVVGPLDINEGTLQVSVVKHVADDDLCSGRSQCFGPPVEATNHRSDRKARLQQLEGCGARGTTARSSD